MSAEAEQPTPMQQDEAPAAAEGTAPAGPAIVTPDAVRLHAEFARSSCSIWGQLLTHNAVHAMPVRSMQVKATEQAALNVHKKLNIQSAPIRQYLVGCRRLLASA